MVHCSVCVEAEKLHVHGRWCHSTLTMCVLMCTYMLVVCVCVCVCVYCSTTGCAVGVSHSSRCSFTDPVTRIVLTRKCPCRTCTHTHTHTLDEDREVEASCYRAV